MGTIAMSSPRVGRQLRLHVPTHAPWTPLLVGALDRLRTRPGPARYVWCSRPISVHTGSRAVPPPAEVIDRSARQRCRTEKFDCP
jgi:hypothetical protein